MVSMQWCVYWAQLDPAEGVEQAGLRPVLIISVDEVNSTIPIVTVLPLTSMKTGRNIYPIETFLPRSETGLPKDSIAMAHKIRAISIHRLREKCGEIKMLTLREKIKQTLKIYFDLF
jgi:mRNA interferase MazF